MIQKQIIAMGGGGFLMEPNNPKLDDYILAATGKLRPKVCFLGTASGDVQGFVDKFYLHFRKKNCEPAHLSIFRKPVPENYIKFLLDQDAIYVGGGSTRNMLVLWQEWRIDKALKQAYKKGIVLAGLSAGGMCWFEEGVTDSLPGAAQGIKALGLIKGSFCPHYDGESDRRPAYHRLVKGGMLGGVACDDGVAAHYINGKLKKCVASHVGANAYQVAFQNREIIETKLPVQAL